MDLQGYPIIYAGNESYLGYAQVYKIPYKGPFRDFFSNSFEDLVNGVHHYLTDLPGTEGQSILYDFSFYINNKSYEHLFVLAEDIIPSETLLAMNKELLTVLRANWSIIGPLKDSRYGI